MSIQTDKFRIMAGLFRWQYLICTRCEEENWNYRIMASFAPDEDPMVADLVSLSQAHWAQKHEETSDAR